MTENIPWIPGDEAWATFTREHPQFGYTGDRWSFHNFLRQRRPALQAAGVIRKTCRGKWLVHRDRFAAVAFELACQPVLTAPADACEVAA